MMDRALELDSSFSVRYGDTVLQLKAVSGKPCLGLIQGQLQTASDCHSPYRHYQGRLLRVEGPAY
ncbi:hypothetical protein E4O93_04810 [Diaphorobacter sp. DS2]|nr:hypothetical protein E4O93_04810 [Diaphorobacter sp. DS2]